MFPTPLLAGQTIGVCAPSSYVDPVKLATGKALLENLGYKVKLHPQASDRLHQTQIAGSRTERLNAFHDLITDPSVHAIIFAGGGNRAIELLPHLNFQAIAQSKKPIMGMSDITALINVITAKTGLVTFHGPMLNWLANNPDSPDGKMIAEALSGKALSYTWRGQTISSGSTTGPLFGGNIAVLSALLVSGQLEIPPNAILFLEDIGEELNRMDRAYLALAQFAKTKNVSGIIIGENLSLIDTGRPFGFTDIEIAQNAFDQLGIPVTVGAPFGHGKRLITFPVGATASLQVDQENATLNIPHP